MPKSKLENYRAKVPDRLLEYWQAYGFAGYGGGLFWMTDPDDYSEVLNAWLYATEFYGTDNYYVIDRSAFGDLTLWGTKTGPSLTIDCPWTMIFPDDNAAWMSEGKGDFLISTWLSGCRPMDWIKLMRGTCLSLIEQRSFLARWRTTKCMASSRHLL